MNTVLDAMVFFLLCMIFSAGARAGEEVPAVDLELGEEINETCAGCHGMDGNSQLPMNPILAGQYEDYLVHALKAYKSGERKNPIMAGMVAALSDEDIADLAAYFARQKGLHDTPAGK